jgi:DNA polymerase-3 subunit gamma/tau
MKYQVLARRYRPRQFEEVVGQESVAATLRGAIQQDRIAHAYVFAGPRGVGKTSMARIFARALNCPRAAGSTGDRSQGVGTPCGTCSVCEAVHSGQDIDVVELDGASHRGIEDIRSIIEGVNRPATRSPYKIYIIDEVHMLTREAFNALLKTLEEPPPHVKFVFATTEPQRIPETVLSRCQRFDFQPIGPDAIVRRLSQILAAEGRVAETGLLERIARYGRGGLRDAETLLDQLMTYSEGVLRIEDLDHMTGRVPLDLVSSLAGAALGRDPAAVLRHIRTAFEKGADPALLLEQTIEVVRARLHEAVLGDAGEGPAADPPSIDRLLAAVQVLLEGTQKLKFSSSPEASAELILLKVARLEDPAQLESVIKALLEVEARDEGGRGAAPPEAQRPAPRAPVHAAPRAPRTVPDPLPGAPHGARGTGEPAPAEPPVPSRPTAPVETAASSSPLDFRTLLSVWGQVGVELEARHPDIAPYFKEREPAPAPESADTFVFELEKDFYFRQMRMPERLQAFVGIVRDVSRAPWRCRLEHAGKSLQFPTGAGPSLSSPEGPDREPVPGRPLGAESRAAGPARPQAPPFPTIQPQPPVEPGPATRGGDGISRSALVKKSLDLFRGRLV